jgi:hypothetical protein
MHLNTRTIYISETPSRQISKGATMLTAILFVCLTPLAWGQQNAVSEHNIPVEVSKCLEALSSGYAVSGRINPFYLRGDFDGDGKADYAVLVRKGEQQGVVLCLSRSRKPMLLGAGTAFNKMNDLNFNAWQVHPKARRVERGVEESKPPVLLGDAILLEWEESASAIVYWNGKHFVWYQQGD